MRPRPHAPTLPTPRPPAPRQRTGGERREERRKKPQNIPKPHWEGRGGQGGGAAPQGTISFPTANGKEEKPQPNTRHADGTPAPPHHPPPLRPPQPCARSPLPAARPAPPGTPLLSALPCTLLVGVFLSCRKFLMLSIMQAASPALPRLPSKGQTCAGHPAHTTAQESLPSPQPPGICSLLAAPSLPFYFQLLQSEPPPPSPRWR